ncbi:MAG TPA: NAD(P)H-binding protein [Trebonia sp.]|nr:NAD(P)H-binding protein [Trebonia sp.]
MIVITTPAGRIGRQVLDDVLESDVLGSGAPVRVIARDPSRLPASVAERVEVVRGSHGDIDVLDRAFADADAVFWIVPPDPRAESVEAAYVDFTRPACDAFKRHEVNRVVGISALGRGTAVAGNAGLVTASLAMDDLIAGSGVSYRALTLPSFMDNLLGQAGRIKEEGVFFSPVSGDRKLPACATRDIAAVAARLLLDGSWSGQGSVPVLGPEDLSGNDMARIMSEVLGRPVRFQQISGEVLKAALTGRGASEAMAQGMVDMMLAKDEGLDNGEPRTPESGSPTTFRQWCAEVLKPAVLA